MKRLNLLPLFYAAAFSLIAGCSDSAAPAAGESMMNDGSKKDDAMAKDGMMTDDMKGKGMIEGDAAMDSESK